VKPPPDAELVTTKDVYEMCQNYVRQSQLGDPNALITFSSQLQR